MKITPDQPAENPFWFQDVHDGLADLGQIVIVKGVKGAELLGQLGVLQGVGSPPGKLVGIFLRRLADGQAGLKDMIVEDRFVKFAQALKQLS